MQRLGLTLTISAVILLAAGSPGISHATCTPPGEAPACMEPPLYSATIVPGNAAGTVFSVTTGSTPINKVDVVFAVDRTSSMTDEINSVKTNALQILNEIRQHVADSHFGVVSFMDYPGSYSYPGYQDLYGDAGSGDVPWMVNQTISPDLEAVAGAIQDLWLGWGADWPQDYTRVLYECRFLPWREGAKRIVILFGDAPVHDLDFAGMNFGGDPGRDGIAGNADDLDFETVVNELRQDQIIVLGVNSGDDVSAPTFRGMSEGFGDLPGTNGRYFLLTQASQIPGVVESFVGSESRIIHNLSLEVAGPYASWLWTVAPPSASEVGPETTTDFSVTFLPPEGTPSGIYAFALRAVGDGVFLTYANITITVPSPEIVTDLGYEPDHDGYDFGNPVTWPTWPMMEHYFGAANVEYSPDERFAAADEFFLENYSTSGRPGSCFGNSGTTLLSFLDLAEPYAGVYAMPHVPQLFGNATFDAYRDRIAYHHGMMLSRAIQQRLDASGKGTPQGVLNEIRDAIHLGTSGIVCINSGDCRGAHALAPFKVVEKHNSAEVNVYDPNDAGNNKRKIVFDLSANTWTYTFGPPHDPKCHSSEVWSGGAGDNRIKFVPITALQELGVPWWTAFSPDEVQWVLLSTGGSGTTRIGDGVGHFVGTGATGEEPIPGALDLQPFAGWNAEQPFESHALPSRAQYSLSYQDPSGPGVDLGYIGPRLAGHLTAPGASSVQAAIGEAAREVEFGLPCSTPVSTWLGRDLAAQGRIAAWSFESNGESRWQVAADSTASSLRLTSLQGRATYDLVLTTRGQGAAHREFRGLTIYPGETHRLDGPQWDDLTGGDLTVTVLEPGKPDRHFVETNADLDMDPDVVNEQSQGRFVTAYIELHAPWTDASFILSSIRLRGLAPTGPSGLGDDDHDGIPDLMVKFDRDAFLSAAGIGPVMLEEITGMACRGADTVFYVARDTIRLLDRHETRLPGPGQPFALAVQAPGTWAGQDQILRLSVPERGRVQVVIFDIQGRVVRHLRDGEFEPGAHLLSWDLRDDDGSRLPSGVYLCRAAWGQKAVTARAIVIR